MLSHLPLCYDIFIGGDLMRLDTILAKDKLLLSITIFEANSAKAILQIIHGAKEHKERYYPFIEYLNTNGYTVIISDNRGHGSSINEHYPLGYMNGIQELIDDQHLITRHIKSLYPNMPLYMIGHSLGSIIARCYLQEHDMEIEKLILIGTANYIPIVPFGIRIGKWLTKRSGKHGYSKILAMLNFDNRDDSWISANEDNLKAYRKDPLCNFTYPNNSILTIFEADYNLKQFDKYNCRNKNLHIISLSGEEDPITGGQKGIKDTVRTLQKIGYRNISYKEYPTMRHEILNETDNHIIYEDILDFLK